jgi:hypothetical protein
VCVLAVVVLLLVLAVPARAATLRHHDLASLALEADAIVVAERTGGPDEAATYRVVKVLAGQRLRIGDAITINQRGYFIGKSDAVGICFTSCVDEPIEPIAILFLHAMTSPSEPAWRLVPSGLRVFAGGRAYRFKQLSNPGSYVAVPQGRDPEDAYGIASDVHWDRAELERAIANSVERADRARAAIAARDPAQILALLPADPVDHLWDQFHTGIYARFYEDRLAIRGFDSLIGAGEIDAALDVHARTRGLRRFAVGIGDSALLARAESRSAPLSRRITALAMLDLLPSDDTMRRLIAIARDADAPVPLRVVATRVLAGNTGESATDPSERPQCQQLAADLQSLVREFALRAPGSVRTELVACAEKWKLGDAVPALAASATQRDHVMTFRVAAAPDVKVELRGVTRLRSDGTGCDRKLLGRDIVSGNGHDWVGELDASQCAEAAQLRIEVQRDGRDQVWTIPIER